MVSIKVAVTLGMLVTLCLLASETSAATVVCCRKYMKTKIPFHLIKGYSVQKPTEMCPISAIIFHTKNGQRCANPALNWVMDYIDRIRYMAQKVHHSVMVK